jgi:hypothetical protein
MFEKIVVALLASGVTATCWSEGWRTASIAEVTSECPAGTNARTEHDPHTPATGRFSTKPSAARLAAGARAGGTPVPVLLPPVRFRVKKEERAHEKGRGASVKGQAGGRATDCAVGDPAAFSQLPSLASLPGSAPPSQPGTANHANKR